MHVKEKEGREKGGRILGVFVHRRQRSQAKHNGGSDLECEGNQGNMRAQAVWAEGLEAKAPTSRLVRWEDNNCFAGYRDAKDAKFSVHKARGSESSALFNPELAENAKSIASKAVCQSYAKLLGPSRFGA